MSETSNSGTTNTVTKPLDAFGICRIIRESAKCQVSRLKIGDLEIDFHTKGSSSQLEPKYLEVADATQAGQPEKIEDSSNPQAAPKVQLTEEQKQFFDDLEEAQMMIEDPLGFEQSFLDRDLESAQRVRANAEIETFSGGSEQSLL